MAPAAHGVRSPATGGGGHLPLAALLVEQIKALLAKDLWSQRAIGRALGVSHGSVQKIAKGTYRQPPPRDPRGEVHLATAVRCACGGMITVLPCRLCGLRRHFGPYSQRDPRENPLRPAAPDRPDRRQQGAAFPLAAPRAV